MYHAKLLKLDEYIEEKVTVEIKGIQFIGFASICPYKVVPNKIYPVELSLTILDDIEIFELNEPQYGLERTNEACGYMVYGQVCGDCIDIGNGLKIQDNIFNEFTYLNSKYVKIRVDRLAVEFLEKPLH